MRRLKKKMAKLLAIFLMTVSCAQSPKIEPMALKWEFSEVRPQEFMACLPREQVQAIRTMLIRCQTNDEVK